MALLAVLFAARVVHVERCEVSAEELAHLHGAYLVARGERPYVDFVARHPPLGYRLLAPVAGGSGSSVERVLAARRLALVAQLLTLAAVVALGWRLRGPAGGVAAGAAFAMSVVGFAWGSLAHLETFAAPLLLAAVVALTAAASGPVRPRVLAAAGLALGLAALTSRHAAWPALALAWMVAAGRSPWGERRPFALGLAGAAVPLVVLLGPRGVVAFLDQVVIGSLAWPTWRAPAGPLVAAVVADGVLCGLALLGLVVWTAARLRGRRGVEDALCVALLGALAGVVPTAGGREGLVVLVTPLVATLAAVVALDGLRARAPAAWPAARPRALLLVVAVLAGGGLLVRAGQAVEGSGRVGTAAVLGGWTIVATAAVLLRERRTAIAGTAVAVAVFALVQQADCFARTGDREDRRRLDFVDRHVGADERVFDGASGYGAFRPHAYRWWRLSDAMRPPLDERALGDDVLAALRREPPRLVVLDDAVRQLDPRVLRYIWSAYEPTGVGPLMLRREDDGATAGTKNMRKE
jgi:hypothetical protein